MKTFAQLTKTAVCKFAIFRRHGCEMRMYADLGEEEVFWGHFQGIHGPRG